MIVFVFKRRTKYYKKEWEIMVFYGFDNCVNTLSNSKITNRIFETTGYSYISTMIQNFFVKRHK